MMHVESMSKVSYLGKNFVYYIDGLSVYIGLETFFKNILGKLGYSKIERCKEKLPEKHFVYKYSANRQETLVDLEFLQNEFIAYEVPEAKFKANMDKYYDYFEFCAGGIGLPELFDAIFKEAGRDLKMIEWKRKDISNLVQIKKEVLGGKEELNSLRDEVIELKQQLQDEKEKLKGSSELYEGAIAEQKRKIDYLEDKKLRQSNEIERLLEKVVSQEQELEKKSKLATEDRLGTFLKRNSVKTYLTIFVICTFLPFTVGALVRYIPFEATGAMQVFAFWMLCIAMAAVWDMSILYFAKTGMRRMSKIGSIYQFLFFCAEFDLIAVLFNDMLGLDGLYWQKMVVSFCIVSFSAVLVNQFTELSIKRKSNG